LSDADTKSDSNAVSESTPTEKTAPPSAPMSNAREKSVTAPRRGRVSSGLALIFAFAALLVAGYLWYALIYQRPALVQLDLPGALANLEKRQDEMRAAIDQASRQIATLTETQNTLRSAVDRVQSDFGRNQTQWIVSETEQLLQIANRRLQLARDTSSALAALRAADRQLEQLASPALLPVRREIAKEISQLETLDRADIAGMTLKLGNLAERVGDLPLAPSLHTPSAQVASADGTAENDSARSIWRDLLQLVQIRRQASTPRPLLAPEQQYFARENMRLMLYGAQHALLQGNVATFEQNVGTASRWVGEYFDKESTTVAAVQKELDALRAAPVTTPLPDISGSLDLLRKTAERYRQP